jgi:hypothetical protein
LRMVSDKYPYFTYIHTPGWHTSLRNSIHFKLIMLFTNVLISLLFFNV